MGSGEPTNWCQCGQYQGGMDSGAEDRDRRSILAILPILAS